VASLNKVMIIGNAGADPEMRFTPKGAAVTSFTVATNRRYMTADGENKEETEWFRVVVWGKQAESCNQFVSKGDQVYVEGRLCTRNWEGQDGQKRVSVEVVANRVLFLGKRSAGSFPEGGELEPGDLPAD